MGAQFRPRLLSVLAAALCLATWASAQTAQPQVPQPTTISAPTVSLPATLEQLPPSPPTVTYENGVLTISAYNSTLSDILRELRSKTGAEIDVPAGAEERVVARLGPGPVRDVLESLLRGSRFNYIIVASETDHSALSRVLLFPKPAATGVNAGAVQPRTSPPVEVERDVTAELTQHQDSPQEPTLPVRAWQQMLQQRRQMVMEQLQQNRQEQ